MKIWKFSGTLLAITGVIHTIVALMMGWNRYMEMIQDGLIGSIGG